MDHRRRGWAAMRLGLAAALCGGGTSVALAGHHHHAASHHVARHRPAHAAKSAPHKADRTLAGPAGTTTIPAAGLRVYCAGRKTPLLVRKFTQGSGTSVTVVCR